MFFYRFKSYVKSEISLKTVFIALLSVGECFSSGNLDRDIVILEATPSGIMAAIAGAKEGHSAVIISSYKHVGGMRTSGLSMENINNRKLFGGLGREFHERVFQYYIEKYGENSKQVKDCDSGFRFEPHVAETIFLDWLLASGVEILSEERIISVQKQGEKIVSVQTNRNRIVKGRIFIDASYEGDLMAMAGVSYRIGRESRDDYKETFAGITYPPEKEGRQSDKIQRYVYRVVLTDSVENQVPVSRPANYHRASFMIEAAMMESNPPSTLSQLLSLNRVPNRKTDVRVGEGWLGGSHGWPEGTAAERATIEREHQEYAAGYLWFILNDKSVPPAVKAEMRKWGYAKDEFIDHSHWPYQLYVREARRMTGEYVMTERDILKDRFKPDGIAIGDYMLDIHPVQYVPLPDEKGGLYSRSGVVREGGVAHRIKPYEIPYRSILPQRKEARNLMVTVCISSTNIAFSTIRMEPVYMMMGHAAGVAASLVLKSGVALHDLAAKELRSKLLEQRAVLDASAF